MYKYNLLSLLAVLNDHVDIVTIVHGKSCVIQGQNSAVKLHVPDGVHGIILAKIHTNHAKFLNFISKSDCIIGPICEYSLHKYDNHSLSRNSRYKIQIPHILRDIKNIQQHVRVRHFISSSQKTNDDTILEEDIPCDIDEKYVTIHTSHFSGYIVTAEAINCCAQSVNMMTFGSLRNIQAVKPLLSVKIYFSSIHSQIKDYERVRK